MSAEDSFRLLAIETVENIIGRLALCGIAWDTAQRLMERFA